MKTNVSVRRPALKTHEGAPAKQTNYENQLRRSVLACLLWEDSFYENGVSIAERIHQLVEKVHPNTVASLAIEAREQMKLRHVPLWLVRHMARLPMHREYVAPTLVRIIQRADELTEFVSLYWLDGRQPLSAQVKKGLASAFLKFDAYQLAKYNRDGAVKLRDVLFLCHAKPLNDAQAETWKQLVDGTLPSPDTWEVNLSNLGAMPGMTSEEKEIAKKETWERMLKENTLGAMALLRNLRNMQEAGVDEKLIFQALDKMKVERVLPFRFITAARYAPQWESKLEAAMLKGIAGHEKLNGKTIILVDVSGSMDARISDKSELMRYDAANGLAILARELCDSVAVYSFSNKLVRVPDRRGFALRDAITSSQQHGSTYLGQAIQDLNKKEPYDRIIVLTDEQSHDVVPAPNAKGYLINVAAYQNGVGYGDWTHIDGWSESVFDYIQNVERD